MKTNRLAFLTILAAAASAATAKDAPVFKAAATNGVTYSNATFSKKPALLVFLNADCPHSKAAAADLNKLRRQLASHVQLVAATNLDLASAKKYAKEIKAEFPIIADPDKKILKGFGAKYSLDFTIVSGAKKTEFPKIWQGYSEAWVREAIGHVGAAKSAFAKLDLGYLPDDRQSGCQF